MWRMMVALLDVSGSLDGSGGETITVMVGCEWVLDVSVVGCERRWMLVGLGCERVLDVGGVVERW